MNNPKLLQRLVHTQFPISKQMGFYIDYLLPNKVCGGAPLEKNVNIHQTAFGGSLYSIGTLTGWVMVKHFLEMNNLGGDIFIKKAHIHYHAPIDCNFTFTSSLPNEQQVQEFANRLKTHKKASIEINSYSADAGGKMNKNVIMVGQYTVIDQNHD